MFEFWKVLVETGTCREGHTLSMLVAESALSHICELDSAFRTCIHEPIAALGVKFGSCDDFGQLFHIRGLDVDNVEALILDVEVPEVDPKVITADKCLAIAVD